MQTEKVADTLYKGILKSYWHITRMTEKFHSLYGVDDKEILQPYQMIKATTKCIGITRKDVVGIVINSTEKCLKMSKYID